MLAESLALAQGVTALGFDLPLSALEKLLAYLDLLAHWNRVYNLTAVRDRGDMLRQHLLDCLAVVPSLQRQTRGQPARVLDVGSGAGLPGIVLAIALPDAHVTCVETVGKKASFIRQASGELRLGNVDVVHARVESMETLPCDVVVSRAFSSLARFTDSTRHHLGDSADAARTPIWLAMKGKIPIDEIAELPPGVRVFHVEQIQVPTVDAERCLVWIETAN